MKQVGTFDIFKVMCERNMDILLSQLDNVVTLRKVKAGTQITIGFAGDVVTAIAQSKFVGGMLLADAKQYEAIRKELEADSNREGYPPGHEFDHLTSGRDSK